MEQQITKMKAKPGVTKRLPNISNFREGEKEDIVKPGFRKNLIKYVQQYTDNTGIHGFRYVGEHNRHIFERICWAVSFGICLFICMLLIIQTYEKWDMAPVLVSFSKTPESIWKVPFPAVTVCPQTKSKEGEYNYTESFNQFMAQHGNLTENELKNFSASSLVCNNYLYSKGEKTLGLDAVDHIINVAPKIENIFFHCRWDLHIDDCSVTFTKILTEDGLCFTSNMLGREDIYRNNVYFHNDITENKSFSEWSLEDGYPITAGKDSFPRRAKYSGFAGSQVLVLMDFEQDLDYSCKGPIQGFKIILHHPGEVPRVSMNYLQTSLEEELLILITPERMTTSGGVRNYPPYKRECFFSNERYLSFFKTYTQQNCEFECLTNHTLVKCGCVGFYMPYEKSTPICGPGSIQCMLDAQLDLIGNSDLNTEQTDGGVNGFACNCLPACSSLSYNAEFSQSYFNWQKVFEGNRENMSELPGLHLTRLTMFFKESEFLPAERNELIGVADFLANCGGIFGLFTGFSFLSLVEIIYFLSLRLICNVKMYGKHYWSGTTKTESN